MKCDTLALQPVSQRAVIIDFTIEHDAVTAIGRGHRLGPAVHIDDTQARMPQRRLPQTLVVLRIRPPVHKGLDHGLYGSRRYRLAVTVKDETDSAHCVCLLGHVKKPAAIVQ